MTSYNIFGGVTVKVAVTYDNGNVFQHFGHIKKIGGKKNEREEKFNNLL